MSGTTISAGVTSSGLTLGPSSSMTVLSGGIAVATMLGAGATILVEPAGIVSATSIEGGGLSLLGGVEYGTTVGSGGGLLGHDDVYAGGVASNTTINAGGEENISGGNAFGTDINSGGAQFVWIGGVTSATVNHGGYQMVGSSGGSFFTTVNAGGSQEVAGGTAYATSVGPFGQQAVESGGRATASIIGNGGTQYVEAGGTTSGSLLRSGATQFVSGGAAISTVVENGATQIVSAASGVSVASNSLVEAGGREIVFSGGEISGATIAGGALEIISGGIASGSINFAGGGALILDSPILPDVVISGLSSGGNIFLPGIPESGAEIISVTAPGLVQITDGPNIYTLQIAGVVDASVFTISSLNGGLTLTEVPCFAAGTNILTSRGEVPVERIEAGDTVITAEGEDLAVVWAGQRRLDLRRHPRPHLVQPIRIPAGALADGVPARQLLLSPDHALFLHGHLVPAKALVGAGGITQSAQDSVCYHHLELSRHAVMFAENTAVESYLDTGNRGCFENAAGAVLLHPDFGQRLREAKSCAPFADAGPPVNLARREIEYREESLRYRTLRNSRE
jgi:autotransporter passenger strand-loop-strand repeat protein